MRRLTLILLCWLIGVITVVAQTDEVPPDTTTITLSYFNAIDDVVADFFLTEVALTLADYDIDLQLVDLETDEPMAHLLMRPTTTRDEHGYNVTYLLNLFQTPFDDITHGIDTTLIESAAIYAAEPATSALFTVSVLLLMADRCDDATKLFDELEGASTAPSWDDQLTFYRGHCALLAEEYDDAIAHFESVLFTLTGDRYWASTLNIAAAHWLNDEPDAALTMLENIGEQIRVWDIEYSEVMVRRAALYADMDELDAALNSVQAAFGASLVYVGAYYERGVIYIALGDLDAAFADLTMYLELVPDGNFAEKAQTLIERWGDS